ncbi:hypothetical protein TNCV_3438401 [Trichonephila clavipes]|nr:hypothetical protein TNCV_3438401 [Trichonephila clavipes]
MSTSAVRLRNVTLIDDIETWMPLRRNRRQYERLTDFDRGRIMASEKQVGRIDVSAATSVGRYGSCSVLATVDLKVECTVAEAVSNGFLPTSATGVTDWRRVVFGDESRFSLSADDHRTCLEAQRPARSDPAFIVERHRAISQV